MSDTLQSASPAIDPATIAEAPLAPTAVATEPASAETSAEIKADQAQEESAPAIAHPWIHQLNRGKAAMNAKLASGEALPLRVAEFWAEGSWPLHTIEVDQATAAPSGDFLERLAKQGLPQAMNVIIHRKSNHHVGATFGPHAFEMSFDYGAVEALYDQRKKAIEDGTHAPKDPDAEKKSEAQKELMYAAYGAEVNLKEESEGPKGKGKDKKFAFIEHLDKKNYPVPSAQIEPEAWEATGSDARALCQKFGLRAVSVPLSFNAEQAKAFVSKLDSALTQLAQFMQVEPQLLGLDKWLGLRARASGAQLPEEALATQDAAALAKKEKEDAKKKKQDSEHGMFMGNFIQIEISPNFEPVVLAHEWFHSLDLWYGSRDIVAKQPWRGWSFFASQVAFSEYDQSEKLKEWRRQLTHGGEAKADFLAPVPEHKFLSQMRFDLDQNPEGEFYLSAGSILSKKLMRCFGEIPMDGEKRAATAEQAEKLGGLIVEAAKTHAVDHENSGMSEESLSRRRKEFLIEWGDLACMWGRRQAGEASEAQLSDMDAKMKAEALRALSGAWNFNALGHHFEKPDVHTLQAMRMDAMGGNLSPYFTTPHEMLAYKLEEIFLSGAAPAPEDKMGELLLAWLREDAVPALKEAREVNFNSLMGAKKKASP